MGNERLDARYIEELVDSLDLRSEEGEHTIKFNHKDCPAGLDTKHRLYITKTEQGTILAYCHHCGGKYYSFDKKRVANIWTNSSGKKAPTPDGELWEQYIGDSSVPLVHFHNGCYLHERDYSMSPLHMEYIHRYELRQEYIDYDKWGWFDQGWQWPVFQEGRLVAFQLRWLLPHTPKVETVGSLKGILHIINPQDSPIVVICEDRCSGVKVAQAGFAACVLHGSHNISASQAHKLSVMFDKFIVWYDNDNAIVKENARLTLNTLRMFTKDYTNVSLVDSLKDPKHYPIKSIENTCKM